MKISFFLVAAILLSFTGKPVQTKNPPIFSKELTPNGDGKNDVFEIANLRDFPQNELQVLSRWGNVVYEASPYEGNWNGTCTSCKKGQEKLPDGTYHYIFTDKETGTSYNGYLTLFYPAGK